MEVLIPTPFSIDMLHSQYLCTLHGWVRYLILLHVGCFNRFFFGHVVLTFGICKCNKYVNMGMQVWTRLQCARFFHHSFRFCVVSWFSLLYLQWHSVYVFEFKFIVFVLNHSCLYCLDHKYLRAFLAIIKYSTLSYFRLFLIIFNFLTCLGFFLLF